MKDKQSRKCPHYICWVGGKEVSKNHTQLKTQPQRHNLENLLTDTHAMTGA